MMKHIAGDKRLPVLLILMIAIAFSGISIIKAATEKEALASSDTSVSDSTTAETDELMVVSKDYVDQEIEKAKKEAKKEALIELEKDLEKQAMFTKFQVIELTAGQQLIAGDSAEIIIRSGSVTAIASENGGLSDITAGTNKDIMTGEKVPLNHLILFSRDDGRGIKAESGKVYLLFKGEYEIKEAT